jgi:glutamate--cysteine ligase
MSASGVDRVFERRLAALSNSREQQLLARGSRGLERESLRVTPDGHIARTPHPRALGSALTNPHITTDYSEALIELVTPTFADNAALLDYLRDLHQFVYRRIGDELLWASSMPCESAAMPTCRSRATADSHQVAREVHLPARAQGALRRHDAGDLRRAFQLLGAGGVLAAVCRDLPEPRRGAGVPARHATSICCAITAARLDRVVSVRRLPGPVPLVSARPRPADLVALGAETLIGPYATSLRMSDLGYRNRIRARFRSRSTACEEYLRDLRRAINTPHAPFAALGVKVDGEYQQLSANALADRERVLQLCAPKRTPRAGERTTSALARAGVEYVEVRALDNSAFDPVGVNLRKLCFLEALLGCCCSRTVRRSTDEEEEIERNHLLVARRGREPGLTARRDGGRRPACAAGRPRCSIPCRASASCSMLALGRPYMRALREQAAKLRRSSTRPRRGCCANCASTARASRPWAAGLARAQGILSRPRPDRTARQREFAAEVSNRCSKPRRLEAARSSALRGLSGRNIWRGFRIARASMLRTAARLRGKCSPGFAGC